MRAPFHFSALLWRTERPWILAGIAASICSLLFAIALLALSGWFITAAGLAGAAGAGLLFDFFSPSAGIRFFALFRTAARYGERVLTHDATLRFLTFVRADTFKSIAAASQAHKKFRSSELLQRLTADLEAIDTLYLRLLVPLASAIFVLAAICLALTPISLSLLAAIGAATLFISITLYFFGRANRKSARRQVLGSESLRVRVIDLIHAQTDLSFSGAIGRQRAKIAKAATFLMRSAIDSATIEARSASAIAILVSLLLATTFVIAGSAYEAKAISGPVMVMLIIGALTAIEIFSPLRRGMLEFGRIVFSANRVSRLSSAKPERDCRRFHDQPSAVSIVDLTFRYGNEGKPILKNFSLEVAPGECVALTGSSGCGKSTLLSLVAGIIQPERGDISIAKRHGNSLSLSYLTQQTELFRGTIAQNLRLAAPEVPDEELWRVLEIVELADKVKALEGRLGWLLGENGNGFSGGERRRLALARIALRNAETWLLDEPTAGLDDALARRILKNLRRFAPGAAWLVSAHHDREIEMANRTISI